jgi:ribose/xylose/arabinose/galactoside ABC-type transport system permease subunit
MSTNTAAAHASASERHVVERSPRPARPARQWRRALSFGNIGAVYVWLLIIAVFAVWVPDTFPTRTTFEQILNNNAVTGLIALSVVIPLAARVFDLSVAFTMTLSGVVVAHFAAHTGIGVVAAVALALGTALTIGLINAFVVVGLGVDSFIGTLATGSLIKALITMVTNDQSITGVKLLRAPFSSIAQADLGGLTLPVLYLLVIAGAIWFVLEHTATGRRLYATGFNPDAARLQKVATDRLRFLSLITSSLLAGVAGVVFTSSIGSGSPTAGDPYLLAAYAAAFLGATQLRGGRFNAWGTVIAVLLLGTGTTGLSLASTPQWSTSVFTGIVLIVALAVTSGRVRVPKRLRRGAAAAA